MLPGIRIGEAMLNPRVLNVLRGQALDIKQTPFGRVGRLFTGEDLEAVWVSKQSEEIDPDWFSQEQIDLILVVQGQLRFEFEREDLEPRALVTGDFMILPAGTRCRAYRWPRERPEPSIFVAVYPAARGSGEESGVQKPA